MPGRQNVVHSQMSHLVNAVRRSVDNAKSGVQDRAHDWAAKHNLETKYVDIAVHFIGASGIPKMDVVGTADPYFVAKLDNQISYVYVPARSSCATISSPSFLRIPRVIEVDMVLVLPSRSTR